MFSLGADSVGLVIRSRAVEAVVMRGRQVMTHARVPLVGSDVAQLTQAIQQLLDIANVKTKKLAVAIQTQDVLLRFFTMPMLPKHELEGAIRFEARKYLPFKIDELIWGYHLIPANGHSSSTMQNGIAMSKAEVVFGAIQRKAFHQVEAALSAAGLEPSIVEPQSLSLARLFGHSPEGLRAEEVVCLVEVDEETAHLAIVKGKLPYLTRDINLLVSAVTAETEEVGTEASGSMDPQAKRLLSELSVSVDFFTREHPSAIVSRVILFGEEARLQSWCEPLAQQFRCSVEMGQGMLNAQIKGDAPLSCASAVGLLLSRPDAATASLDFLKRSALKTSASITDKLSGLSGRQLSAVLTPGRIVGAGVVATIALLGLWLWGSQQIVAEQQQLEQLKRARPVVGFGLERMDQQQLGELQGATQEQLTLLKHVVDNRVRVSEKLDALVRSLPQGMWVTGLTFEDVPTTQGKSQFRLSVNGACYLGEADRELSAIQMLEERVKSDPVFFKGFRVARVGEIGARLSPRGQYAYRTFQLHCESDRSM